jgi:hypothetical protein
MKKTIIIVSIMLFSLAFAGCKGGGPDPYYDPYRGIEGLSVEFIRNAPPETVYEKQQIPIGLILKNNGAYDITEGVIAVAVEEDYMTRPAGEDNMILLRGRSQYDESGEEEVKMFYSDVKSLDKMSEYHRRINIIISSCYRYAGLLKTTVCIDPDLYNINKGEKPCTVEPVSSSGQGGPVAVTKVEETLSRDKDDLNIIIPIFEITIENMGSGKVTDYLYVNEFCGPSAMPKDSFNKVYLDAYVGDKKLVCMPNPVTLGEGNTGKTMCRPEEGFEKVNAGYTTLLSVSLDYGYTFSMSKNIAIEKLNG